MRGFVLEVVLAAPPEQVWERIADHERLPEWLPLREAVRRRPGAPDPNGVGAVRTLRGGGFVVEERITLFEPPERLAYTLVAGAPVRDHHAVMELEPAGAEATRLRWMLRFRPLVPGTGALIERLLRRASARGLTELGRSLSPGAGERRPG